MPVLSVAAAAAQGETIFRNAGRLRIKESDRLAAMAEVLTALGADVTESEDSLAVRGVLQKTGADGNESEDTLAAEDPLQNSGAGKFLRSMELLTGTR